MKLKYNAPVTLTFSLICGVVLLLGTIIPGLRDGLFVAAGQGGFSFANPLSYLRLFSHIFGHADIGHLLSNLTFILLLGPILESLYGARNLIFMMLITAVATAVLNLILFPSGLLGASGIVFMMILLSSFTNFAKGAVPGQGSDPRSAGQRHFRVRSHHRRPVWQHLRFPAAHRHKRQGQADRPTNGRAELRPTVFSPGM